MNFHTMTAERAAEYIRSQPTDTGKKNILKGRKKPTLLKRFIGQFSDFMIIILLIAAAISFVTATISGEGEFIDPIIILVIVVLNAVLGVIEESRADNALEALKKMSSPSAKVRRGGKEITVSSEDVRIGDVLILDTGCCVPADARLLKATDLEIDESSLTGESMPISKDADVVLLENIPLGDRKNMLFSGTNVTRGKAEAIVTSIGMDTEMGKIAALLETPDEEPTPLQQKLAKTGKYLGIGALMICALVFFMGIFKSIPPFTMFITAVSLAVAAIPEGLPAIVTVVLAIGVQRMAKKNAIVRHLSAVETLGSATVICSDKTGTLTQNKMTVTKYFGDDQTQLFEMAALCCDSLGNPTESAILSHSMQLGIDKTALDRRFSRLAEKPFDSTRKAMSVLVGYYSKNRIITKGAAEIILEKCVKYIENDTLLELTDRKRREILSQIGEMGANALRVLAVAYKDTLSKNITENELIFCGLIGISDPPRPEAARAVSDCIRAGITPVMITGDNKITACAIAKQIGILGDAITGAEMQKKTDSELTKYRIYARVTPEDKMRIVKAFKAQGEIVAMTGDGVNDAPALKAADIGCSMGKKGTDVAKEASDLILVDDNFATIISAVREGRGIYENIKKSIRFLLSSNIGEILTIFMGILFGWEPPLIAIQLLWVNLVTDSLPALALGVDPIMQGILSKPPKKDSKSLFSDGMWFSIIIEGCFIGGLALTAYLIGMIMFDSSADLPVYGRTMAFCVLSMSQLFHAFNMRSEDSVLNKEFFKNKLLICSLGAGVLMQLAVVNVPVLAQIFKITPLGAGGWSIVFFLSMMPIAIIELQKRVNKYFHPEILK